MTEHVLASDLRNAVLKAAISGRLLQSNITTYEFDYIDRISCIHDFLGDSNEAINLSSIENIYPERWIKIKLNDLFDFVDYRGKTPHKTKSGVFLVTASNIKKGYMDYTRKEYITKKEYQERQSRGTTKKGDILFTTEAPMGMAALCDLDECSCGQRIITFQPYVSELVNNKLMVYFILSPCFQKLLSDNATGTTAQGIKGKKLMNMLIPLPPIEEQQRIVDKVDELMAKIDEYEKIENQLVELKRDFPTNMKDSILQAAMQGKLTEQLKNENSNVVKTIIENNNKYSRMINNEIPDSWDYVQLKDIVEIINGFTPLRTNQEFWNKKEIPWFTVEDIHKQGRFINNTEQFITQKALTKGSKRLLPKDSILLCCTASVGEYAYSNIELTTNQQFNGLVIKEFLRKEIYPMYLYYYVQTLKIKLISNSGKTTFNFLSTKKLGEFTIPIPPIEEQQRIVDLLDKLLPLCDDLKEA